MLIIMQQQTQNLSNIQLELLKIYSNNISENTLLDIKNLLANYFAQNATESMDKFIESNNISNNEIKSWSSGHF